MNLLWGYTMNIEMYHESSRVIYHESENIPRLFKYIIIYYKKGMVPKSHTQFFFLSSHRKREETRKELEELCMPDLENQNHFSSTYKI